MRRNFQAVNHASHFKNRSLSSRLTGLYWEHTIFAMPLLED